MHREKFDFKLREVPCHSDKGVALCYIIYSDGIEVNKSKIDVIGNLRLPTYVKDVRSFSGHAGFHQRFIQDFSKIFKPLSSLLAKDVPFHFS